MDVLYSSWREERFARLAMEWLTDVCERLDVIKDVITETGLRESEKRKYLYDHGKVDR